MQKQGIPIGAKDVFDTEFADNTALVNLQKAEHRLGDFCYASSALINWQNSLAFWISEAQVRRWRPHLLDGFQKVSYLGSDRY